MTMLRHVPLCLLLAATACAPSFETKTPSNFVKLDQEDATHAERATTADGVVVAIREIEHEPEGDLTFWVEAIKNTLRQRGGYALLSERDVRAGDVPGKELRFGHDEGSKPHEYELNVFVTEESIYILEAGGTQELMKKHAKEVDEYVASFRVQ